MPVASRSKRTMAVTLITGVASDSMAHLPHARLRFGIDDPIRVFVFPAWGADANHAVNLIEMAELVRAAPGYFVAHAGVWRLSQWNSESLGVVPVLWSPMENVGQGQAMCNGVISDAKPGLPSRLKSDCGWRHELRRVF